MMKQFYTLHIPPQGHKASIQHQKRFWLAASALTRRSLGDFSFPDSRSKTACRATPASAATSTPAAYRARQFPKSPLTHFAASPLRKRSRSVRLLGCKRPRDGSLSLPTFCEKKEGARGGRSGRKNRGKAAARRFFRAPQEGLRSNFEPFCPCHRSKPLFMRL